jgi:cytochrome d ubiquinol oxidase subunit I
MSLDVEVLSRVQFALTIMFHYLFPPLSIGLAVLMVFMEGQYLRTSDRQYHRMTRFWTSLFAVNFAMGVATGIVMEFQFGTNWAGYARYVGDIFGSALAAEGIFAFFLESGFLAVLVFGWDRVSPRMHFVATVMVAFGSIFSAVWIVVANSWQHTPAGFVIQDGRAVINDFWAMIFNPSAMIRLAHVLLASFLLGAFFVMSVSAFYLLRNRHVEFSRTSFSIALNLGVVCSILMPVTGHVHAKIVEQYQPAKLAALEGHYTTGPADLYLFGWSDPETKRVYGPPPIPGGLSFLCHESFSAEVKGLNEFRPEDLPPLRLPFVTFHLMVVLGVAFIGLTLLAVYLRWRGTLFEKRWLLRIFFLFVIGPYLANQTGWLSAEVGRQPFIVYPQVNVNARDADGFIKMEGGLRTTDGLSSRKVVTAENVLTSIVLFAVSYLLLFVIWFYVLNTKILHGPEEEPAGPAPDPPSPTRAILDTAALMTGHEATFTTAKQEPEPPASPSSSRAPEARR